MSEELILRTENICKSFNGIQVLKNVNLEIRKGEIHALMGENGAGKSTIIKIITGVYTKDDGEIYIDGQHVVINNRHDAAEAGISVIYQELSLVPELTVTENIFLGHELMKRGLPDKKEMRRQARFNGNQNQVLQRLSAFTGNIYKSACNLPAFPVWLQALYIHDPQILFPLFPVRHSHVLSEHFCLRKIKIFNF